MKNQSIKLFSAAFVYAAMFAGSANALYINTPYVEKGMLELELKNRFDFDSRAGNDRFRQHQLEIGYGITKNWALKVQGEVEKEAGSSYKYTASEVENIFQFTENGEYWADVGAKLAYEFARPQGSADKVEAFLLLAKNWNKFTSVANIGIEKEVGSNSNRNPEGEIKFMTKYNYIPMLNPGFEYYGSFGEISHNQGFEKEGHSLGPVLYGKLGKGVKYELGALFGISKAAPDTMLKFNIEYEFPY